MPTTAQIKEALSIAEQIETLQNRLSAIMADSSVSAGEKAAGRKPAKKRKTGKSGRRKRTVSAEARKRMAAAQRKRWAKKKAG